MRHPSSEPFQLKADAAGKMMLLGEYAVLEGAPALLEATDARAKITLRRERRGDDTIVISGENLNESVALKPDSSGRPQIPESAPQIMMLAARIVATLGAQYPHALSGLIIRIDTAAFYEKHTKIGLGSSAAVTAALLAGLFAVIDGDEAPPRAPQGLWAEAQKIHQAHQKGVGSGADIASSLWGGRICFRRDPLHQACEVTQLPPLAGEACLFAVFTGVSADTPSFLAPFRALKQSHPGAYWQRLEPLGALAQAGSEIWQLGQATPLIPIWRAYQNALHQLGQALGTSIVTPAHQTLGSMVERLGGAYKVSGAGGGDIGVVLCPARAVAQRISRKLVQNGFVTLSGSGQAPPVRVKSERL